MKQRVVIASVVYRDHDNEWVKSWTGNALDEASILRVTRLLEDDGLSGFVLIRDVADEPMTLLEYAALPWLHE